MLSNYLACYVNVEAEKKEVGKVGRWHQDQTDKYDELSFFTDVSC